MAIERDKVCRKTDVQRERLSCFFAKKPMRDIIAFLQSADFDSEHQYYEFFIAGEITLNDMRSVIFLPYEICILEEEGQLILVTGRKNSICFDGKMREEVEKTKLFLHSHRFMQGHKVQANSPSIPDLLRSSFDSPSATFIVVCEYGLVFYQKPSFNPITGECFSGDMRDLLLDYCEEKGINAFGGDLPSNLRNIYDLNSDDKLVLQRQFAVDTKSIRRKSAWDNEEEIKNALKLINRQNSERTQTWFQDPFYLPSIEEVIEAFGGQDERGYFKFSDLWWNYVLDPKSLKYEILTEEYISELSKYLRERIKQYKKSTSLPLVILEIGAGDGRLSHFLRVRLNSEISQGLQVIAVDNKSDEISKTFTVETMDKNKALEKYKPTIVICSWMPLEKNWTEEVFLVPGVKEVILIGNEEACGTPESWGNKLLGSKKIVLRKLEGIQIGRIPGSSTVSLRR